MRAQTLIAWWKVMLVCLSGIIVCTLTLGGVIICIINALGTPYYKVSNLGTVNAQTQLT